MGLFRKKSLDFSLPPEDVIEPPPSVVVESLEDPDPVDDLPITVAPETSVAPETAIAPEEAVRSKREYGIHDAIKLLRDLPGADTQVVMAVVRKTLESTEISVTEIVADGEQTIDAIEDKIEQLEAENRAFHEQIADRNKTIASLKLDLDETTKVMQSLLMSESAVEQEEQPPDPDPEQSQEQDSDPGQEQPEESETSEDPEQDPGQEQPEQSEASEDPEQDPGQEQPEQSEASEDPEQEQDHKVKVDWDASGV